MPSSVTIGDKTIVFAQTFLLADNQTANVVVDLGESGPLIFQLIMRPPDESNPTNKDISWHVAGSVVMLSAIGWRSPLGLMVAEPVRLGEIGGKPFYFQIAQHFMAGGNLIHFMVLLGGLMSNQIHFDASEGRAAPRMPSPKTLTAMGAVQDAILRTHWGGAIVIVLCILYGCVLVWRPEKSDAIPPLIGSVIGFLLGGTRKKSDEI